MEPTTKRAGRPSRYKVEYAEQAFKLCLLGAIDDEIADFFGISVATLNVWKKKHPEFMESLTRGRVRADTDVTFSLYQRATGYHCVEEVAHVVDGNVVITQLNKHYPPDVTAQIFWLKNRRPKQWRDRPEPAQETNLNVFPPKEVLDALYARALAAAAEREAELIGRRERLGAGIDGGASHVTDSIAD